jgi:hypothetical protein
MLGSSRAKPHRLAADEFIVQFLGQQQIQRIHREETVELPSGYGHAWANNLGEYILTEEAGFNPNETSNLHWEPMPPQ